MAYLVVPETAFLGHPVISHVVGLRGPGRRRTESTPSPRTQTRGQPWPPGQGEETQNQAATPKGRRMFLTDGLKASVGTEIGVKPARKWGSRPGG
jgi:hypothetical protein